MIENLWFLWRRGVRRMGVISTAGKGRWFLRAGILVLLAGYLLFCHGCHGDEDNELFASLARSGSTLLQLIR